MKAALWRATEWLANRPGYLMLVSSDARVRREAPQRFEGAWWQVLVLSALWGLVQAWLWAGVWVAVGDYTGLPLAPAAAVVVLTFLWLFRRATRATGQLVCGDEDWPLGVAVIVAVWTLLLLGLQGLRPDWPMEGYPHWLKWTRPQAVFRPLLLAPAWGGWAMMATCLFCRRTFTTKPVASAFATGCGPLRTALVLAGLLTLTVWYFDYRSPAQAWIAVVTIVAATAAGLALSRGGKRLTRRRLLATNLIAQTAFYVMCLANR